MTTGNEVRSHACRSSSLCAYFATVAGARADPQLCPPRFDALVDFDVAAPVGVLTSAGHQVKSPTRAANQISRRCGRPVRRPIVVRYGNGSLAH
jgi:hypothetical protein